jgi:hypothetical protein
MLRQIASLMVGALLMAPLGFGLSNAALAALARTIFALLVLAVVIESLAAAVWTRRWPV